MVFSYFVNMHQIFSFYCADLLILFSPKAFMIPFSRAAVSGGGYGGLEDLPFGITQKRDSPALVRCPSFFIFC